MINFCTLFDSNYLARGLALYESLNKVCSAFHLYVVAFDDLSYNYLKSAGKPNLTPISLNDFEDPELLAVKPTRSIAEYCWTCTPSIILYCIRNFNLHSCTYVDADMIFYEDPKILFDELKEKSVLITEHRYSREYDHAATHGIYCVQFMYFKNDVRGTLALTWWRDRCIEWCYAYQEDGKFGDQKYLDDWTTRFEGVHVLQHPGGGVAPWNLQQYTFQQHHGHVKITRLKDGQSFPLVFFHFHGLKFYTNNTVSCSGTLYEIEDTIKSLVYIPYIKLLIATEAAIKKDHPALNANGKRSPSLSKPKIYLEFMKELLINFRLGKLSPFKLRTYNFKKHYHYYNLSNLE
ncbi:hypothetical protein [Paraflavitalea pollutisoli]|uniref:hypothetical protein n=1 Tax=Paraflavitalea pollutisoli TaxID=3034143 RepID=UPI0023EBD9F1|nr:hypothetical protein [Paraflavitalea sp. H1-2-19X]